MCSNVHSAYSFRRVVCVYLELDRSVGQKKTF
nr:MAG TPA: hypothetical protein [Caudoviricetes sp.]